MADKGQRLVIADLRGGRNGFDPPWAIRDNECADAVNVHWYGGARLAKKRGGSISTLTTFSSGGPFTGTISSLFRHLPSANQTAAELWAIDDAATNVVGRMAGATTFAAPTLKDNPTGNGWDWTAVSINGLLVLAYKSAQGRLHCWDGSTVRRMGLAATGAPTAADSAGGGGYAAVLRYYRQRSTVQVAGVTTRRSEPSASVSFTPDGSHASAVVTQATVIGEGETHWEVEASTDNSTFYRIATVAIGTTTYSDSAATTTYNTNPLSALTGVYSLFPSCKFVAADQNRLLALADWTSTGKQSRLYISAVIGSSDIGDAERIDNSAVNSYIDFDENDSGVSTGLAGPIFGTYFVFKDRMTYQLTPTGNPSLPYEQLKISPSIGALHHLAIAVGEDAAGNPALYWMSHRGPYKWSINGLEYIGRNMEDYTLTGTMINLSATNSVARTIFYGDQRQVWFWWATGSSNDCNQGAIYDITTGGWSRIPSTDGPANVRCAVMFANTLGTSMSLDLKPYIGQSQAVNRLWKCNTGTDDNGTKFQAYVTTKAREAAPGYFCSVGDPVLLAQAVAGISVTVTGIGDFGVQTMPGQVDLSPLSQNRGETRISRPAAGAGFAGQLQFVQHQIGDTKSNAGAWTLERLTVPFDRQQPVSQ